MSGHPGLNCAYRFRLLLSNAISCVLILAANQTLAQGTAFTYQGILSGANTNGPNNVYDLRFTIYDTATAVTNIVSGPLTNTFTFVSSSSFVASLDFGQGVFNGDARWLEIAVRPSGAGSFTVLTPRQPVTASPYAILAGDLAGGNVARLSLANTNKPATGVPQIVNGFVVGATITSGGSGYITAPAVTLSNTGGGTGAVLTASISGGHVISLSVLNAGFGYSPATTLSIDPPPNDAYQVFAGANYFTGINVLNNPANTFAGTFAGNGAGLTNVSGVMVWQTVAGTAVQAQRNTGYVLTNSQTVTVTLPVSPNLGDIVRVTGVGAGGWKISQNSGQSVLTATFGTPQLRSVASSADGSKLVAAARLGGRIYTSTNSGVTWTPSSAPDFSWTAVASSADGSKLVATATSGGPICTSTNSGSTWTLTSAPRNYWISVASSSDGSKLAAAASGQPQSPIYTSTNSGADWMGNFFVVSNNWSSVASSADGSTVFAAASSSPFGASIYVSTNNVSTNSDWVGTSAPGITWRSVACSSDGSKVVAVAEGSIYTSANSGANWAAASAPALGWVSVASSSDGTKLVAVSTGSIYTSTNSGGTWTAVNASSGNWSGVAISSDGSKFIVVGDSIYSTQFSVASTTVGPSGYLTGGQSAAVELQYIGNGQFRPLSYLGNISGY
jgi:hypothetical protein